jgi:hypothetical protein
MKHLLLLATALLIFSCNTPGSKPISEGTWTGYLTPMNHPDMKNEVSYNVQYTNNELGIELKGPGGQPIQTMDPHIKNDSLFYSFNEPEEGVTLTCKLAKSETGTFEGRCTDPSGKWALFSMIPPNSP